MGGKLTFDLSSGGGEYELLDPDIYDACLLDIEEVHGEFNGEPQTQLQMTFAILDETGQPTASTMRAYSGYNKRTGVPSVHEKTRLGKLIRALGYDPVARPEELLNFDLESLYHRPVRLVIEAYQKQNGEDGRKVTGILPKPKRQAAPAPARPTAPVARPVRRSVAFDEGDA